MLSTKQQEAIDLINNGENIFLTGSGGVGKSYVIDHISTPNTLICAPTGIAALNVGGITCHKAFGLPTEVVRDKHRRVGGKIDTTFVELFSDNSIQRIIIDEVSMLRRDYFELIDFKLKKIKKSDKPFGGIQVVVVGDFFQLEPIVSRDVKGMYYENYDGKFAFTSPLWKFKMVELTEVYRQSDKHQIDLLNRVRKDVDGRSALAEIFKGSSKYVNCPETLHLCCYNKDADEINKYWYSQIEAPQRSSLAEVSGKWGKNEYPADLCLNLKVGTRVIITANDPSGGYVNGDRGVVLSMYSGAIEVQKLNGEIVFIEKYLWKKIRYKKVDGVWQKQPEAIFKQFPLRYSYAISVHKSQGMSLDGVSLDVGNGCFSHGQLYVALSRIKDLSKIQIKNPIRPRDLIVDSSVKQFYEEQRNE